MKRALNSNDCVLIDGTPYPIGEAIADNFVPGDRLIGLSRSANQFRRSYAERRGF